MKTDFIEEIEEYWTVRSESYSAQNIEEMNNWKRAAWRDKILSFAPSGEKLKILDIGTGPGFFAINLALAGHDVTAVDVTPEMLVHARENAKAYDAQVEFIRHNGEQLPFEDNTFDLIVSRNVIWTLQKPQQALMDWQRVLRPGGRMIYFDANWYLYLFDKEAETKKAEGREMLRRAFPETKAHTENIPRQKIQMLEDIARELYISRQIRPQWDANILEGMGMRIVYIQNDIAPDVLNEKERLEYWGSPMFMVCAEKVGGGN